jgi:leucyl aminopeptidase
VVDIATLTGACIVALGHHKSGLFTRDDAAHNKLANEAGWQRARTPATPHGACRSARSTTSS